MDETLLVIGFLLLGVGIICLGYPTGQPERFLVSSGLYSPNYPLQNFLVALGPGLLLILIGIFLPSSEERELRRLETQKKLKSFRKKK